MRKLLKTLTEQRLGKALRWTNIKEVYLKVGRKREEREEDKNMLALTEQRMGKAKRWTD